ncbi:MAG TPA: asparagine synthase B [Thermoanaerobaculia bacterium]|jgi:asparagine synthase (glutamine-hydrolysing)|nr:asparagine synthase B [Thermoanaerobaculia bacterium]
MCGIVAIFDTHEPIRELRQLAIGLARRLRHRGPDWSGVVAGEGAVLAHERLSIVDVEHGAQPLVAADGAQVLTVNGEIYNHRDLAARLQLPYPFQTASDCEVILALWREKGPALLADLDGIFAFALWDREQRRYLIARDRIGVCPLYIGRDDRGQLIVASELKALEGVCRTIEDFPPGSYLDSAVGEVRPYWQPAWRAYEAVAGQPADPAAVRAALESAVERQLMSDVPYGVLLSGGLDSSLVAAIAARFAPRRVESGGREEAWWPRLHSFAIGLDDSPDLTAARRVAAHIGSVHHELRFTVQEGIDALADVIYHLETYDVTTVRAATPMYLMARRIKAMGVKMVLSGEGADEVFAGYLYFHKAPSARALHEETVRKLDMLHKYDCLRANKAMAAWGVEARVPFLDPGLLDVAMSLDPERKRVRPGGIEKELLRSAFVGELPDDILWRQKEQFSDGVGYSWIDSLKAYAAHEVSDEDLGKARWRFPYNTPATKEAYLYRVLFAGHFPSEAAARCVPGGDSVACSTPAAIAWDPAFAALPDPSGRAVRDVHRQGLGVVAS